MLRGLEEATGPIAVLDEDLRRRMYLYIRGQRRPVTRDEAAREIGISRKLAAFHLDKMVERGLLITSYARPEGRSGRGAGRTSKRYEPSDLQVEVSIPERRYDLAGRIMVEALAVKGPEESGAEAARRAAHATGLQLGEEARRRLNLHRLGPERALTAVSELLRTLGFEPYRDSGNGLVLGNCPFRALANQARGVVCVMNQAFVEALIRGLGNESLEVETVASDSGCCARVLMPNRMS